MDNAKNCLSELNSIIKESDEIYRNAAKTLGLPDCAFWILYALRDNGEMPTQRELCNTLYQPKQTINSSLKKMESDGYIELLSVNDHRSKKIRLTEKGISLAEETVDKVILLEQKALSGLSAQEQTAFISLFRKYTQLLNIHMDTLNKREELNEK